MVGSLAVSGKSGAGLMKLFEIRNGSCGESYVRSYVWAENETHAAEMFAEVHPEELKFSVDLLFDSESGPFVTFLSDSGFGEMMIGI